MLVNSKIINDYICDRPGCDNKIIEKERGSLLFSVYYKDERLNVPKTEYSIRYPAPCEKSDLCTSCSKELAEWYWKNVREENILLCVQGDDSKVMFYEEDK